MELFFSVIIPVYNQFDQLKKTLSLFQQQSFPCEKFEIIIVNDGSPYFNKESLGDFERTLKLRIVTIKHSGSGAARNAGVKIAKGEYVVFCDADRIPDIRLLDEYYDSIYKYSTENSLYQGRVQECYAIDIYGSDIKILSRFSRDNQYYKKVMNIYEDNLTTSSIRWASFMVGNSCISKKLFEKTGGFDPQFSVWGFEHFDLAVRMMEMGIQFISVNTAKNYHIPHSKSKEEYVKLFNNSAQIMNNKYKKYNDGFTYLVKYLCGELSLQQFEACFSGKISSLLECKDEIYYQL